jgi:hypothetical protein
MKQETPLIQQFLSELDIVFPSPSTTEQTTRLIECAAGSCRRQELAEQESEEYSTPHRANLNCEITKKGDITKTEIAKTLRLQKVRLQDG